MTNTEIERKWILSEEPFKLSEERFRHMNTGDSVLDIHQMIQGYIPTTLPIEERIRIVQFENYAVYDKVCYRTLKSGKGLVRMEFEEEISSELAERMFTCCDRFVRKTRYTLEGWEIDVFDDRNLVLCEREFTSVDEVVSFPDWLAPYIVREVTNEPGWSNNDLALPVDKPV